MRVSHLLVLAGLISGLSQAHAAPLNCNAFWAAHKFGPPFECQEVYPSGLDSPLSGVEVRFFHYTQKWDGAPKRLKAFDLMADAVKAAIPVYQKYGKVPNLYFVQQKAEHPENGQDGNLVYARAEPENRQANEPCLIVMYPESLNASDHAFRQTMAHEIFHCFQGENFPPQIKGPLAQSRAQWQKDTGWWVEGTANFFSNLAFPAANLERSTQYLYDGKKPLHLQQNVYSTSLFWQSVGGDPDWGPEWILKLFSELPKQGGAAEQRDALTHADGIADIFHKFACDSVEGNFMDSDGKAFQIPYQGFEEKYSLPEGVTEVTIWAPTLTVKTARFKLEKGYRYTFPNFRQTNASDHTRVSIRSDRTLWRDLQATDVVFDQSCGDQGGEATMVFTTTEDLDPSKPITFLVKAEKKPCSCDTTKAAKLPACFTGKWKFDPQTFKNFWDGNPELKYQSSSGDLFITVGSDGGVDFDFQVWRHVFRPEVDEPNQPKELDVEFDGALNGLLGVTEKGNVCFVPQFDGTTLRTEIKFSYLSIPAEVASPFADMDSSENQGAVSCTATELTYQIPRPNGTPRVGHLIRTGN